jgi:hypothetical protein
MTKKYLQIVHQSKSLPTAQKRACNNVNGACQALDTAACQRRAQTVTRIV